DHRDVGSRRAKALQDQDLGGVVGFRDRTAVGFAQRLEAARPNCEDRLAGAPRQPGGELEEGCIIHGPGVAAQPARGYGPGPPGERTHMIAVEFGPATLPSEGALALLAMEGAEPGGLWAAADEACGGALRRAAVEAEFT